MRKLVEHFFRHEYSRLVAMLSRRVGVQYIETVEDAVQSALMTALEAWTITGLPDNPSAWLFRVAHNDLMGALRQRTGRRRILEQNAQEDIGAPEKAPELFLSGEVRDDLLRMLFICCDEAIPVESQLVLALKTLCGFGCSGDCTSLVYQRSQCLQTPRSGPQPFAEVSTTLRGADR